jgi:hypothetical protein
MALGSGIVGFNPYWHVTGDCNSSDWPTWRTLEHGHCLVFCFVLIFFPLVTQRGRNVSNYTAEQAAADRDRALRIPTKLFAIGLNPNLVPACLLLKLSVLPQKGDKVSVRIDGEDIDAGHREKFDSKKMAKEDLLAAIGTGFYAVSPLQAWRNFKEGCESTTSTTMSQATEKCKPYNQGAKTAAKVIAELEDEVRLNAASMQS